MPSRGQTLGRRNASKRFVRLPLPPPGRSGPEPANRSFEIRYLLLHEFAGPDQEWQAFLPVHTPYEKAHVFARQMEGRFERERIRYSVTAEAGSILIARVSMAFSTEVMRSAGKPNWARRAAPRRGDRARSA